MSKSVAVITGGTRGIGLETARFFAGKGWDIALCSRDPTAAESTATDLQTEFNVRAIGVSADVSDISSLKVFAAEVARFGVQVDCLICNAAILGPVGTIANIDHNQFRKAVEVNFLGVSNSINVFWDLISRAKDFRIVALAGGGLGGAEPMNRAPAYVPSKAAVVSLVELLAAEVRDAGGTINALSPGNIPTNFLESVLKCGPETAGSTLWNLAKNRDGVLNSDALNNFFDLLNLIVSSKSFGINGRLLSSRWNSPGQLTNLVLNNLSNDIFRLRRIDNDLFLEQKRV